MGVCCISPNWLKTRTSVHVNISEVLNWAQSKHQITSNWWGLRVFLGFFFFFFWSLVLCYTVLIEHVLEYFQRWKFI
jgi:hypothetical protein